MAFDMTKCKIGGWLRNRRGDKVYLAEYLSGKTYPYLLSNGVSVSIFGEEYHDRDTFYDIMGFWEEEPTEEDEQSFPNIEKRIPYVVKTVTYRVHFNELYSRDITSDEAEAIYEQLKTLLGK